MKTHTLKTLPPFWDAVLSGEKTFEVRRDDRGFQKGDILYLIRSDGRNIIFREDYIVPSTGNQSKYRNENYTIRKRITYVLTGGQFGIAPGHVVMGLGDIE